MGGFLGWDLGGGSGKEMGAEEEDDEVFGGGSEERNLADLGFESCGLSSCSWSCSSSEEA